MSLLYSSATVKVDSRSALIRNGSIGHRNTWTCAGPRASDSEHLRNWRRCCWNQLTVPCQVRP